MKAASMTWLSLNQVSELTGWHSQHVRRLAAQGKVETRTSKTRGRNGKQEREYLLSSLPADAQTRFIQKGSSLGTSETAITKHSGTLPLFPPSQQSPRVALNPEQLKEAERKIAVIAAVDKWDRGFRQVATLLNGKQISTKTELLEWLESQHGVSVSTIRNWAKANESGGPVALARKVRSDRGHSKLAPQAAAFIESKYLNREEGHSCRMCFEALLREWHKLETKGNPPSYATVRRHLRKLPEPLKVLARVGKRAYESSCSPFVQRGPVPVMDWWVSDHRVFDVLVRNSLFAEMPADKAYRVWMTAIFDWGSRKLVGFCFAPTPSSRTISSALRMAILNCGMPRNFYWDNGEDYKKVRRDIESITLSQEATALLARDRVGVTSALPFHPRSKPIESWFARWSKRFDVLWRPAYLGNKPGNRPESAELAQKQHAEYLTGKRGETPLPTDAEFIAATIQWIEEYNDTPLESLGNRRPNDVMERQSSERSRVQVNRRVLDILLSERVSRTVMAGGCVRVDNMTYEPTEESLFSMDVRKGRDVIVVRDPYNLQEATAADPDTMQFIGELRVKEFVAQCPNGQITRDQIKANMRKQRSLRKGYGEYMASLQAIATSQGWRTEREALLERAGVLTGTDGSDMRGLPGSRRLQLPDARPRKVLRSAFVSDAVAAHADAFRDLKVED
jgi:putative transposase